MLTVVHYSCGTEFGLAPGTAVTCARCGSKLHCEDPVFIRKSPLSKQAQLSIEWWGDISIYLLFYGIVFGLIYFVFFAPYTYHNVPGSWM